jgi:hypothetical protein
MAYLALAGVVIAAIALIVGGAFWAGFAGAGLMAAVLAMIFMAVLSGSERH